MVHFNEGEAMKYDFRKFSACLAGISRILLRQLIIESLILCYYVVLVFCGPQRDFILHLNNI